MIEIQSEETQSESQKLTVNRECQTEKTKTLDQETQILAQVSNVQDSSLNSLNSSNSENSENPEKYNTTLVQ